MENIFKMIAGEEHEKALTFVCDEYFKNGFGSLSKTDIDLIFFTLVMRHCHKQDASDYTLSKLLQITQGRVRSLKVKMGLKYEPVGKDKVFQTLVENARYARVEEDEKRISLPIYDPNVFIELENLIEVHHGYVEFQLNPKIFTIRIDQLFNLVVIFHAEQESKSSKEIENVIFEAIKKVVKKEEKFSTELDDESLLSMDKLKEAFVDKGVDFILDLLFSAIPGGTLISQLLKTLKERLIK
jgi:hypothetical protein